MYNSVKNHYSYDRYKLVDHLSSVLFLGSSTPLVAGLAVAVVIVIIAFAVPLTVLGIKYHIMRKQHNTNASVTNIDQHRANTQSQVQPSQRSLPSLPVNRSNIPPEEQLAHPTPQREVIRQTHSAPVTSFAIPESAAPLSDIPVTVDHDDASSSAFTEEANPYSNSNSNRNSNDNTFL